MYGTISKWFHLECANFKKVKCKEDLVGFEGLEEEDQEKTTATLFVPGGTSAVKRALDAPDALDAKALKKIKVAGLREELKNRGLEIKGKKAELIERLVEATAVSDETIEKKAAIEKYSKYKVGQYMFYSFAEARLICTPPLEQRAE
jgi:hypothetical protein